MSTFVFVRLMVVFTVVACTQFRRVQLQSGPLERRVRALDLQAELLAGLYHAWQPKNQIAPLVHLYRGSAWQLVLIPPTTCLVNWPYSQ